MSLTASILAILGAGGTIAKGMGRIRRLAHAPEVLLQLNNEVTDMHLLISSVDEVAWWWIRHVSTSESQQELVSVTLSQAKDSVLELEKLVAYILTKETSTGNKVDLSAWVRNVDRIKDAKDSIRRARENLNVVWIKLDHEYAWSSELPSKWTSLTTAVVHYTGSS